MILKIKGADSGLWHLFDNVEQLSYDTTRYEKGFSNVPSEFRTIHTSGEWDREIEIGDVSGNTGYEHSNNYHYMTASFVRNDESYLINFDTFGFVMNDQGETIEKIGSPKRNTIQAGPNINSNSFRTAPNPSKPPRGPNVKSNPNVSRNDGNRFNPSGGSFHHGERTNDNELNFGQTYSANDRPNSEIQEIVQNISKSQDPSDWAKLRRRMKKMAGLDPSEKLTMEKIYENLEAVAEGRISEGDLLDTSDELTEAERIEIRDRIKQVREEFFEPMGGIGLNEKDRYE